MTRIPRLFLRLLAAPTALFILAACRGHADNVSAQRAASGADSATSQAATAMVPQARWPDPSPLDAGIDSLYRAARRSALWFHGAVLSPAADVALAALRAAPDEGLRAADYHVGTLDTLALSQRAVLFSAADRARFDRALSASLLAYLEDVRFGRAAGAPPRVIAARDSARAPLFDALAWAADHDSVAAFTAAAPPHVREYADLRTALARYRALAADATIATVHTPGALPVHPGDSLAGAAALRGRLVRLGDMPAGAAADTTTRYDSALVAAVRRFQQRHGLQDDGVIGRETLTALQAPLSARVRQVVLAMERVRRQPRLTSGRVIVVNVPAFRLYAYDSVTEGAAPSFETRVIVGRAHRTQTPTITEQLRYLDFWPYWNVPRSIQVGEIVPQLRKDSLYLRKQRMEVVGPKDRPLGDGVTAEVLRGLVSGTLRVRQKPGPGSALGRVKFVIPNDSSIYLHDTPDKSLFARARRDLSHGCIRVEKPRELAAWVLRDRPEWSEDSLARALAGPAFRRVMLARPIQVIVEYNTAIVAADGNVWFLPDVYGRDAALAAQLFGGSQELESNG